MLTVDELRGHVTTDLDDEALGLLLDAAYEAIDIAFGVGGSEDYPASITEVITTGGDLLMLSRPASAVTSVIEGANTPTTLEADDYELLGGQMVRRARDGTNPQTRWAGRVTVTYTALSDENERDRVAIALVNLDIAGSPGVQSERLGDWAVTHENTNEYAASRAAILASLGAGFIAK